MKGRVFIFQQMKQKMKIAMMFLIHQKFHYQKYDVMQ